MGLAPALRADVGDVLPGARDVGRRWELLDEAPVDTAADADFVEWGVRSVRARHYTRTRAGTTEVCSLEVWGFARDELARRAHAEIRYPDWEFALVGSSLVMARGLRARPGQPPHRGVFDDCRDLWKQACERAAGAD